MVMKIRVASLGAVKPILGSKVPSLETLLPDMEKKIFGFFISDDGKGHSYTSISQSECAYRNGDRNVPKFLDLEFYVRLVVVHNV